MCIRDREKKLSGDGQIELLNRVEQLQGDVLRLRGEIEDLAHHLEAAKRQQKEHYTDLDRRIQALTPIPPTAEQPATPEEAPASEQDPNAQPPANPLPTQQAPAPAPTPTPIVTPTPAPTQAQAPAALTQAAPALATARPPEPPKQPAPTYAVQALSLIHISEPTRPY